MDIADAKIGMRVKVLRACDSLPRGYIGYIKGIAKGAPRVWIDKEVRGGKPEACGWIDAEAVEVISDKTSDDPPEVDMVNHPPHYTMLNGLEVIDVTEQFNFCLGNALKYIMRADHKHDDNGIEDLRKSAFYVQREIDRRQRETSA